MILGKYETVKRLGKGAFGDVVLAEDKNKNKYAIKMIPFKSFAGENSYLLEYLESEIQCLKQMDSPYVMKLYATEEDKKYKYMICEYCDGGDIITVQSKQPNKVFPLQKATEILSYVIKGLFSLHNAGFVHRDIKAENILMKTENGQEVYKLADFGFTKNIKDISYTILGTGAYMSPQIYSEDNYGFEVDMWAFGVLFYFILNMEFPFKLNSVPKTKKKSEELMKLATNFSYKSTVEKSRKKIMENCTPELQDLFQRIFNPIPKERIDFHDIRSHKVFKKYFPEEDNLSQILYKGKSKKLKNKKNFMKDDPLVNAKASESQVIKSSRFLQKEQNFIQEEKEKIEFLKETVVQIEKNADLPLPELLAFKFNLQKYIILMLKKAIKKQEMKQQSKNLAQRWKDFFRSDEYSDGKKDFEEQIKKIEFKLQKISDNCEDNLQNIVKINPHFEQSFDKKVTSLEFQGSFKKSYRKSTLAIYQHLIKRLKQTQLKGNLLNYHLALITICHAFHKIFSRKADIKVIFEDYFKSRGIKVEQMSCLDLKTFMAECTPGQLNAMTKEIIVRFFSNGVYW